MARHTRAPKNKWSNQVFDQLTDDKKIEDAQTLETLREKHMEQLERRNVLNRALTTHALINWMASRAELTEGSMVYPFRRTFHRMPFGQAEDLLRATRLDRVGRKRKDRLRSVLAAHSFAGSEPAYAYFLKRIDYPQSEFYIPHQDPIVHRYFVGVALPEAGAAELGLPRLIPTDDDFSKRNIALVQQQLREVAMFKQVHDIRSLDPLTLELGHGEYMGQ